MNVAPVFDGQQIIVSFNLVYTQYTFFGIRLTYSFVIVITNQSKHRFEENRFLHALLTSFDWL